MLILKIICGIMFSEMIRDEELKMNAAKRFIKMLVGFFILALGSVVVYQSKIGLGAWDVLSDGVSKTYGIQYGDASIFIGIAVLMIGVIAREKIGVGTLLNILCIGKIVNFLLNFNIIPAAPNYFVGILMGIASVFIITFGIYMYISAGFGAGPRDTFLTFVTKKTGKPVGSCRMVIELCAVVVGFCFGGSVGLGTILMAVLSGPVTKLVFGAMKFDIKAVNHMGIGAFFQAVVKKVKA